MARGGMVDEGTPPPIRFGRNTWEIAGGEMSECIWAVLPICCRGGNFVANCSLI